jgi:peptidoglycan/LPS O-acetylase OafA/YrhL
MSGTYATFQKTDRFGSLDGLRAVSIIVVIWCHTAASAWTGVPLLSRGYLGVELFFAISGFLITTLLLRERRDNGQISLARFYARRTLRIFPLYYTVVLIYTLVVWLLEHDVTARAMFFHNLLYYATYTSNWFVLLTGSHVIFYFAWSLAAEEQFYLLWPTVEKTLRGAWPVAMMLLVITASLFVYSLQSMLAASGELLPSEQHALDIGYRLPLSICLGVLLAHLLDSARGYAVACKLVGWRWSSLAAFAVLVAAMAWSRTPSPVFAVLMVALVASCVIREDHLLAPLLRWRPLAYMGTVSYGMYLMHMLSCNLVKVCLNRVHLNRPVVLFAGTVLATTVIAGLSFRYYESIFLRLKSRFSRKRPLVRVPGEQPQLASASR